MKKKYLINLLFLAVISLSSCSDCEKLNLAVAEKAWVNHFKVGENYFFKNSKELIDTLQITDSSNYYTPCNQIELSKYQYEIYMVLFKIRSKNNYNGNESSITMTTQGWKQRIPYIYLGNLGPHRNDLENKLPVAIDTILGNQKLTSTYHYSKGVNTEQYGENEYFKSFFWDKQLGLVAYITANDDLFIRIKL